MRPYSDTITLTKNRRGVWDFDTSKGCTNGVANNSKGCYDSCYAASAALRRGFDFSKTVFRCLENRGHDKRIISKINKIDMPFIRIGVTGDPSENWEHTLNVCRRISVDTQLNLFFEVGKSIVIITKHWSNLSHPQLTLLKGLKACVNTSVSALDEPALLSNRLKQYNKLKEYCKSVLRIVSCDFNLQNTTGKRLNKIQQKLFDNDNVLDTVLRVNTNNKLVSDGVINIDKVKFLDKYCFASMYNKSTYFGKCSECPEMCGLNLN